ncbi:tetratricopeptide repeat protein, partial [Salmonella enterica subsp. enterica serovar Typhimurium]
MNHSITSHPCDNVSLAQLTELAQSGNSEAQYILGRLYNDERIDGSEEDKLSFYWLQQAAEQGHCEAQYWLGLRYKDTPTDMKDNTLALFWSEKAAQ